MAAARAAASLLGAAGLGYFAYTQMAAPAPSVAPVAKKLKNQAFVFVKPHAVGDSVHTLVRDELRAKGVSVVSEGEISSEVIDDKKLIDQHYYAIASKATILKPEQMNVPADKFEAFFGKTWESALASKKVLNALDACKQLNISPQEMDKLWATAKKNNKLVKFGGGFYCGEITYKKETLYVFNGFFMEMRGKFTTPGQKIHYYTVEWEPSQLSWSDFRGKVLGPTDPKDAPQDSLRGRILRDWKTLGLKAEPNVGDNAVHASASPFEAMAERMNWLQTPCPKDDYCSALVAAGIPEDVIRQWSVDPQVKIAADKKKSLFDSLEDLDAQPCLARAQEINALRK